MTPINLINGIEKGRGNGWGRPVKYEPLDNSAPTFALLGFWCLTPSGCRAARKGQNFARLPPRAAQRRVHLELKRTSSAVSVQRSRAVGNGRDGKTIDRK
ncbi:hypothetical protein Q8A73_023688 [Channa argus]|nr:hypothetical protein Q8A73_023688 [Channa argus]